MTLTVPRHLRLDACYPHLAAASPALHFGLLVLAALDNRTRDVEPITDAEDARGK